MTIENGLSTLAGFVPTRFKPDSPCAEIVLEKAQICVIPPPDPKPAWAKLFENWPEQEKLVTTWFETFPPPRKPNAR